MDAATVNPLMLAKALRQRKTYERTPIQEAMNYPETWSEFGANVAINFPIDSPESVRKAAYDLAMNVGPQAIVWHGSPHKFLRFDSSKIGTGEGAQAYGHGLYLAESPEVARGYRGNLSTSEVILDGKNIGPVQKILQGPMQAGNTGAVIPGARGGVKNPSLDALSPAERDAIGFIGSDKSIDAAIANLREQAGQSWRSDSARKLWAQRADTLEGLRNRVQVHEGGALYKVDLPDDQIAKMLDWDKPLSQQPKEIRDAINKTKSMLPANAMEDLGGDFSLLYGKNVTPNQFLNTWEAIAGRTGAGEEALRQAGIPGIRYFDQGSRGTNQGTSNFVVFPGGEDMLKILEINGVPVEEAIKALRKGRQ